MRRWAWLGVLWGGLMGLGGTALAEPEAGVSPLEALSWLTGHWQSEQDPQLFHSDCGSSEGGLILCSDKTLEDGVAVEYGQAAFERDGETVTLALSIRGETLEVLTLVESNADQGFWRFANPKYGVLQQLTYRVVDPDHYQLELIVEVDRNTQQTSLYDYRRVTEG